ncbi:PIG-L family deacetylase [Promicromonospora sp. NPDC052451]|uniref:PIG-L family deacetylase n=1 Tax=Promicromonospora sp. NPDC052451 TaxID=3364407 RepID=UPI0037C91296
MHAHPDDETLSTGGLIATFAAAGLPVCVVTCTRGERGEVIALPGTTSEGLAGLEGDGPALGAYRETELAAALEHLARDAEGPGRIEHVFLDMLPGVPDTVSGAPGAVSGVSGVLSGAPGLPAGVAPFVAGTPGAARYEDSGMAWVAPGVAGPAPDSPPTAFARVPLDEPAGRLAALIRARRPAVVATYEPGGGYGHPDHVRTHQVTVRALELAAGPAVRQGQPWDGPELWQAVAPAAEVRAARATLAALPEARELATTHALTLPDPHEPLPPLAKPTLDACWSAPEPADPQPWSAEGQVIGTPGYRSPDDLPITRFGGAAGPGAVRVDVRPVLGRVVAALRAHATQVQHATALPHAVGAVVGWYALSNDVLAPLLADETYLVTRPFR